MSIIQNNNDDYEENLLTSRGNFQLPQGIWKLYSEEGFVRILSLGNIIVFDNDESDDEKMDEIINQSTLVWNPNKKLYQALFNPLIQIIVDFKCENKLAYECVLINFGRKYKGYMSYLSRVTNNILNQLPEGLKNIKIRRRKTKTAEAE